MLQNKAYIAKMNRMARAREPFLFIIDFLAHTPLIYPLDKLPDGLRFSTPQFPDPVSETPVAPLEFIKRPISLDVYRQKFGAVVDQLDHGNSYLINLTQPTPIECNWDLESLYSHSKAPYKLLVPGKFVVFSPEIFIKTHGRTLKTFPMKGTIDAGAPDATKNILDDPKELAEHFTIVDLMRNDLSRVASKVEVEDFRFIDRIQTHEKEILQVSSRITAELPEDHLDYLGDWLFKLLPAGSITGAPKEKTVEIILETEAYYRGYYTGIFGVFDGQNLDSAVLIRFIEQTEQGMIFKSGGGITYRSVVEKEYQELKDKVYVPFAGNYSG